MVTKFEVLPNEILTQCFEYLNAPYLFHSFNQLNHRFNDLIRRIPLCINLKEDLAKSTFENFCAKMSSNPGIKDQVYSLNLPSMEDNDHAGLRTNRFLSFFPLEDFVNLRKFKANVYVNFLPTGTISWEFNRVALLDFSMVSFPELRTISLSRLHGRSKNLESFRLSITSLTLEISAFRDFYWLSQHTPMLQHLHLCRLYGSDCFVNKPMKESFSYLKKLIIDDYIYASLDEFELFVKFTPNLENLTISANQKELINAARWKQLITRSLLSLNTFQFKFSCSRYKLELNTMIPKLEEFQSDFWRKEHHWFTEYAIANDSICVYTIPYVSNKYELKSNYERHRNYLTNNSDTFINVTNLKLSCKILKKKCEDYFSNVTSLELEGDSNSLTIEEIECLKKIVNPFHLKQLDLSRLPGINSSLLLKLLDQIPQLSVLSVWRDDLINYFNNSELCKCLNNMIKKLYVEGRGDDLFKMDDFYKVFRNIEHLQLEDSISEELFLSLSRLPKLSTLQAKYRGMNDPGRSISVIENELIKLNLIYDINNFKHHRKDDYAAFGDRYGNRREHVEHYDVKICVWRDNAITRINHFQSS